MLLQEIKQIAPDIWESRKRCLILPQKLGGLERPEYIEGLKNVILKLYEFMDMLNAELISKADYESKKAEILFDFAANVTHSPLRYMISRKRYDI